VDATDHSIIGVSHNRELENAKILMAEKRENLEKLDLKVQTLVNVIISGRQEGTISTNILETAKKENVSLIILGARGKKPDTRPLFRQYFVGCSARYKNKRPYHAGISNGESCRNPR